MAGDFGDGWLSPNTQCKHAAAFTPNVLAGRPPTPDADTAAQPHTPPPHSRSRPSWQAASSSSWRSDTLAPSSYLQEGHSDCGRMLANQPRAFSCKPGRQQTPAHTKPPPNQARLGRFNGLRPPHVRRKSSPTASWLRPQRPASAISSWAPWVLGRQRQLAKGAPSHLPAEVRGRWWWEAAWRSLETQWHRMWLPPNLLVAPTATPLHPVLFQSHPQTQLEWCL